MKKVFLALFATMLSLSAFAQVSQLLVLDNYHIPVSEKGAKIGKVITQPGENVILQNDPSGLFTLDKQGYINLKKDRMVTGDSPLSYQIVLKSNQRGTKAFELVKDNFIRNKVIAHRGAWKNQDASQNSMKALKKAIELGCEGSEFDVWLSSDNVVVLSHDPSIGGKKVEETTAAELFRIALKDGDNLPSLEEYIQEIKKQNKTRLVLEVKASQKGKDRCEAVADSSVQIVHRMNAQGWTDYITFNYDAALRIRQLDPTANILYLEADKRLEELKAANMTGIDYHFSHFLKDTELVNKAKALKLLTNVWTVNKEEDLKTFLGQNVDYITTDEPELLLKIVTK